MVLSGEAPTELFVGYLYFLHKAPNAKSSTRRTVQARLPCLYDCLGQQVRRLGRGGRVPSSTKEFMDVAMRLNLPTRCAARGKSRSTSCGEAFEDLLPHEVAWRQKRAVLRWRGLFSGSTATSHGRAKRVTDQMFEAAAFRFPSTPTHQGGPTTAPSSTSTSRWSPPPRTVPHGKSVACSTPTALEWDAKFKGWPTRQAAP